MWIRQKTMGLSENVKNILVGLVVIVTTATVLVSIYTPIIMLSGLHPIDVILFSVLGLLLLPAVGFLCWVVGDMYRDFTR